MRRNDVCAKQHRRRRAVLACGLTLFCGASGAARANVYTVTTADDDGPGSLRQAILSANVRIGPDTIQFRIGSGAQTVSLLSPLPDVTDALTIDGSTQPGYADRPLIEIEGSMADTSLISGLTIRADKCAVRGLALNRFGGAGIWIQNANAAAITNCYFGLDPGGSFALGNTYGLILDNASRVTVSGCVLSGNAYGLWIINGSGGNSVLNCQMGTDFTGSYALGNLYGVLCDASNANVFDSDTISGNQLTGITLQNGASGNRITGNVIGLGSYFSPLPNGADGVDVFSAGSNTLAGNIIAANISDGVLLSGTGTRGNVLTGNIVLNSINGVRIENGAASNTIGGATSDLLNVLAGNYLAGIFVSGVGSSGNAIANNHITSNGFYGVAIASSSNSVTSNAISGNGVNGVWVGSMDGTHYAAQVPIRFNSIVGNGDLGIWLDGQGTQGGNNLLSAPYLIAASATATAANAQGVMNGTPNTAYEIQFFLDFDPNPSGFGDGEIYLASNRVTTDAFGRASINYNLSPQAVGLYIAATATDPNGNTSAFSNAAVIGVPNPVATLYSVSPSSALVGSPGGTLTVNGDGFVPGATVRWNGQDRATNFVSSKIVTAQVSAADFATVGAFPVTVTNPLPGGGDSAALTFTVQNPPPVIAALLPASTQFSGPDFLLTINGSGFVASSVVKWNGGNRPTSFVSPTQLIATVFASDIAAAGTAAVTVLTPGPGGGTAAPQTFSITYPAPSISALSVNLALVGNAAAPLTVTGSNFVPASVVRWNGQSRVTTFVSAAQVVITIPVSDLAAAGVNNVTVLTPGPGGGETAALPFTVANSAPTLLAISPSSASAGSSAQNITVTGTGFVPGSVVNWNGSPRATTYVSATTLTAAVTRTDLAAPGNFNVTVASPAPGGGESAPQAFTVRGIPQLVISAAAPTWVTNGSGVQQLCITFDLKNSGTADAAGASITAAKLGVNSAVAPVLPLTIGTIAAGAALTNNKLFFSNAAPMGGQTLIVTLSAGGKTLTASRLIVIPPHP